MAFQIPGGGGGIESESVRGGGKEEGSKWMNKERKNKKINMYCATSSKKKKSVSKSWASCNWQGIDCLHPLGKGGGDTELKVNINIDLTISERFIKSIKFITCTIFKHFYKHNQP